MLAHEPLVQLLVPSLGAMIDKVPQARARIADAQKRLVAAIRDRRCRASRGMDGQAHPRFPPRLRDRAHRARTAGRHRIESGQTDATGRGPFVQTAHIAADAAQPGTVRAIVGTSHAARGHAIPSHSTSCIPSSTSWTRPFLRRVDTWPSSMRRATDDILVVMDLQTNDKKMITYTKPEQARQEAVPAHRARCTGKQTSVCCSASPSDRTKASC